jgi:hypothetical protein
MAQNKLKRVFAYAILATIPATAGVLATAAQSTRTKWKPIRTSGGACQYSVPADWRQEPAHPAVSQSPGEDVVVIPQKVNANDSFDQVKKQLQDKIPPLKVLKDSAERYWYVYRDPADAEDSPDTHWIIALEAGGQVCATQITFKSANGETIPKQIVATIKHSE